MIYLKHDEEIELIRKSSVLVCETIAEVSSLIKVGSSGSILDKRAEEFIRDHGGIPAFKGHHGFPASLCISINEAVVHGIPNELVFQEGDLISVDCGVVMNGYYGDSAYTFGLGNISEKVKELMKVTEECLYLGINASILGNRVEDISWAIQNHAEKVHHYGVVRELVGHGIGKSLHEAPEVPNYGQAGKGPLLKEGMTIAIEPMINLGTRKIKQLKDGWTVITADKLASAHYEHTIAICKEGPKILSNHEIIKNAIKNNPELLK